MDNIYIVTDLGPGDGGKGSVIHALANRYDASVIIKRGGAQGSHGVRTSRGESFAFSQWGCGTLEGIPTFCSEQLVISPVVIYNEAKLLQDKAGIADPFAMLFIDPACICATPYHTIASQIEELKLGEHPRGTVGTGVGQAYRAHQKLQPDFTLHASELTHRNTIQDKLSRQRQYYSDCYLKLGSESVLPEDQGLLQDNLELLRDDGFLNYCVDLFVEVGQKLNYRRLSEVLTTKGIGIVECSHGVLTDCTYGLKPHVSALPTLPSHAERMLRQAGYQDKITHLAVHRAYEIRHGAGPIPTYDAGFTVQMLPYSHKAANRWQGKVRAGPLDFELMKCARDICKQHGVEFAGLCLTWFDQIIKNGRQWTICPHYQQAPSTTEDYTQFLLHKATPKLNCYQIPKHQSFDYAAKVIREQLGLPLAMLSLGPTERDKIFNHAILP